MFTYFKMKRNEIKVKATFYETISEFINNKKDILALLKRMYTVLKDVPADQLREEFIKQLAEIIYTEGKDLEN